MNRGIYNFLCHIILVWWHYPWLFCYLYCDVCIIDQNKIYIIKKKIMIITSYMHKIIQIHPCLLKLSRKQESVTDRRYYYIPYRYRGGIIRHPNDDWSSGFKGWKEGVSNRWKDGRQTPKNGNSDCLVRWAKKKLNDHQF